MFVRVYPCTYNVHVRVMRIAYVVHVQAYGTGPESFQTLYRWSFSNSPLRISGFFLALSLGKNIVGTASGFNSLLNFMPKECCRLATGWKHSGLKWSLQSFELVVGPLHLARVSFNFAVQSLRYFSSLGKLCILVPSLHVLPQPAATHLVGEISSASWSY